MRRLTVEEFRARFPRPSPTERVSSNVDTFIADRDMIIDGLIKHLVVRSGAKVVVTALIEQSIVVERGGLAYVDGLVDGRAAVDGALYVGGHVAGGMQGGGDVFDPTSPADSEVSVRR